MQDGYDAVLANIEAAAEAGEDIHEAAKSLAMEAFEQQDAARWVIGDLANLLVTRYGNDDIGQFAIEINMAKARVRDYARTCAFWQKSARVDILSRFPHPVITYSHMRESMRLEDLNAAIEFIEECADKLLTVEQSRLEMNKRLGKPEPLEKLAEFQACLVSVSQDGIVVLQSQDGKPDLPANTPVKVTIHLLPQQDD